MKESDDLFKPTPEAWLNDAKESFENWMAHQPGRGTSKKIRVSSAEVYRAQWGRFADWIGAKGIKLIEVNSDDISEFLAHLKEDNRAQRDRYRKLIQRVLADLFQEGAIKGAQNPAAVALYEEGAKWKDVDGNLPTSFLAPAERESLIQYLITAVTTKSEQQTWRNTRDRAIVGLFMGAGLKVSEVASLTVNCINLKDGPWINIRYPDSQFSHRTRPVEWAIQLLKDWLAIRAAAGTEGDLAFPTDVAPRIRNHKLNVNIHPATLKRITDGIIAESGVKAMREGHRASPQTLRNTFGAVLFEQNASPALVAECMGFTQLISAERLQASWNDWRNGSGNSMQSQSK